jgi:hypothetical protein
LAGTHRVDVSRRENDTELSRRQSNLESFEENKNLEGAACALRHGFVGAVSIERASRAARACRLRIPLP